MSERTIQVNNFNVSDVVLNQPQSIIVDGEVIYYIAYKIPNIMSSGYYYQIEIDNPMVSWKFGLAPRQLFYADDVIPVSGENGHVYFFGVDNKG